VGPLTAAGTSGLREAAFDGGTRAVALAAVAWLFSQLRGASAARRQRCSGEYPDEASQRAARRYHFDARRSVRPGGGRGGVVHQGDA
jgi:hypothetical protein